jgi:hypothetical protein
MPTIADHHELNCILHGGKFCSCAHKYMILRAHHHEALCLHVSADIGADQPKEGLVQADPLQVFTVRQRLALTPEYKTAQAMIFAGQNDKTEKPIHSAIWQHPTQHLRTVNKGAHPARAVKNGPGHDHSINQVRALNVDLLQNHAAYRKAQKMRLLDGQFVDHR